MYLQITYHGKEKQTQNRRRLHKLPHICIYGVRMYADMYVCICVYIYTLVFPRGIQPVTTSRPERTRANIHAHVDTFYIKSRHDTIVHALTHTL